jgi:Uncharacterized protein conserved in bacteria
VATRARRSSSKKRANKINYAAASLAALGIALILLLAGLALKNSAAASKAQPEPQAASQAAESQETEPPEAEETKGSPQVQPPGETRAEGGAQPSTAQPSTAETRTVEPRAPEPRAATQKPAPARTAWPSSRPASYKPEREMPAPPRAEKRVIIFVIDDAGYNMSQLEPFLKLPFPLTIAVLPGLPYSAKDAAAVKAAGKELILHQPMEALGGQDPGPGAIRLGMSDLEIEAILDSNLASVPGAVGINNHMGSAVTTDFEIMGKVATVAKKRGIYYLDSLTTSGTATAAAARREGIRYWERDVFLDNVSDRVSIIHAIEDGKKRSSKGRPAIMIGHVWSAELAQTLTELYPQLVEEGFSLSTISRFMVQEATEDDASPGN